MKIGTYRFKKSIGKSGYFAHVELALEKSKKLEIIWDDIQPEELANNPFFNAAVFGIHVGLSKYRSVTSDYSKFQIWVSKFHTMAVDSCPNIVAYVASRAVLNALLPDYEPVYPILKGEERLFIYSR